MLKYLKIAQKLVELDSHIPELKLCMADIGAGQYTPSDAAYLVNEGP
jgi:hypothetical protein